MQVEQSFLVRNDDPQTSIDAASLVVRKLSALHIQFIAELRKLGQASANEVAEALAPDNFGRRNTIRRRASDLAGPFWGQKIRAVGERRCTVTGKSATIYEALP